MRTLLLLLLSVATTTAFAQGADDCQARLVRTDFSKEQKYVIRSLLSTEPLSANSPLAAKFWVAWPTSPGDEREAQIRCWRKAVEVLASAQRNFWANVISAYRSGDGTLAADLSNSVKSMAELPPGAKALFDVPDANVYRTSASEFVSGVASQKEVVWMGTKIPPHALEAQLDVKNWARVEQFLVQGISAK